MEKASNCEKKRVSHRARKDFNQKKRKVFSQVKKNESALEKIKGYQGEIQIHLGKMEFYQIERKKKPSLG